MSVTPASVYHIAVSPVCGCWVMVSIVDPTDEPEWKAETFRELAKAVKQGYNIQHLSREDFLKIPVCKCPRDKKGRKVHQPPGTPETGQLTLLEVGR